MTYKNRRTFLKAGGSIAVSGALLTTSATGNDGTRTRFLIDLEEVSRTEVPDTVEIIHDISGIDILAARGDPDDVPGATSTTPDVAVYQDGATTAGGPVQEVAATGRENKGPAWDSGAPTPTELQWDKRVQRVGDLTERPDDRRVVHDTTEGEGTRVAVVDTGVSDGHPDLADSYERQTNPKRARPPRFSWVRRGAHGSPRRGSRSDRRRGRLPWRSDHPGRTEPPVERAVDRPRLHTLSQATTIM